MTYHALIIEDNTNDAGILKTLLAKLGVSQDVLYDSRTFTEGLINIQQPDVIFLDLEIPGTSGYEVLSLIQSIPDFENIPVVAYTANSAQMQDAKRAGFHSFLGKPLRSAEFPSQLERILKGEPVWEVR